MYKYALWFAVLCVIFVGCQPSKHQEQKAVADTLTQEVIKLGELTYSATCSKCHKDSLGSLAPGKGLLAGMSPRVILSALTIGKMKAQAEKLSDDERKAVAQWITNQTLKEIELPQSAFTTFALGDPDSKSIFNYSGWGGNLEGTGFRSAEQAGITPENVSSLRLKWAFAIPNGSQVRSKPALVGDWLIAGTQFGELYALQRKTGKIGWTFQADAAIRGAITYLFKEGAYTAYFADYATNVYAVDIKSGKVIWKKRAGDHPLSSVTGSVAVYDGRVYVPITSFEVISAKDPNFECCTSSGGVVALGATTGDILWRHRVIPEAAKISGKKKNGTSFYGPSGAPVWSSPTVDSKRGLLFFGTGENYTYPPTSTSDAIQALDLVTGKLKWSWQATSRDTWNLACPDDPNCPKPTGPDLDFGMAPLLVFDKIKQRDVLIVGQKSGVVHALSPDDGKVIWQQRIGKGGALGGVHWGMATDGELVYAPNADNLYALDLSDSTRKATPGLYALKLQTGEQVWKVAPPSCDTSRRSCQQSDSAAPTVIPGIVFAGDLNGFIRGYSTRDGKVLWEFDTVRPFETVNGQPGKGGSLDGSSPLVADGMVYVNSGYGVFGQMPGNVLLAFTVEKK